jgi:hypothetical protein
VSAGDAGDQALSASEYQNLHPQDRHLQYQWPSLLRLWTVVSSRQEGHWTCRPAAASRRVWKESLVIDLTRVHAGVIFGVAGIIGTATPS